jgi:hypothetical protein
MKQHISLMIAVWVLGATAFVVAQADQQVLKLNGSMETPAVTTKASGVATLVVKADGTVTGGVTTTGLDGTAAHIHQGAVGTSGPPIITLQRAGTDQWLVPDGAKLTPEQMTAFKQRGLYINVHSKAHPDGEIRAQLQAPKEATSP